jgi:hypothetical protein
VTKLFLLNLSDKDATETAIPPTHALMSRSRSRNVNFFDGSTGDHLGGVRQNGSITNINFFHMLMDTLLIVESTITIKSRTTGQPILLDTEPLEVGDYDIFCPQGKFYENYNKAITNLSNSIRYHQTHR